MDQLGKFTDIFSEVVAELCYQESTNKYMEVIESKEGRNGSDLGIRWGSIF